MARDATRAGAAPVLRSRGGALLAAWRPDLAAAWRALWVSRLVVWAAGLAAIAVWGVHDRKVPFDPTGLTRPFGAVGDLLVAPAARWDATWYLTIAGDGYDDGPRTAFFPLYPLLVHALGAVVGSPLLAAVALSFALFAAGLAALHRLAAIEVGAEAARWAVLALALFPGSLWFSAAYSESLFLALSVGAVLAARTDHWAWAGALGALAAGTRSAGVLLVVPLALLWVAAPRRRPADLAWMAAVPLGLAAYCGFLALDGLPADAPFQAQDVWHRTFTGPLGGVRDATVAAWDGARQLLHGSPDPVYFTRAGGDPMEVARHNLMLYAFLAGGIAMLVGAWRRLAPAHGAYATAALLLPLSTPVGPQPLMSLPRFLAVLYPLFLWLGWWMARGPRWRAHAVLGVFAAGLAAFSALFSTWHWVA
ncbi:MAG: hypothetical protein HZB46_15255 [Solirubrobacterales bacterium]|nr:hypothetical protein [Solirubrobacterales bacterium]